MRWFTSSRPAARPARQARIAARKSLSRAKAERDGRFGGAWPQRRQRYLSRRFAVRRATDHQ
jgi:hypothetical protein